MSKKRPNQPPGPTPGSEGDHVPKQLRDVLSIIIRLGETYGDVVRCPSSYGHSYLLNQPDYARHMLTGRAFQRTGLLKIALGESSLSSDGEPWRRQRKIVQPAFAAERLLGFAELMRSETLELAERWNEAAQTGAVVSVDDDMMRLTLRIVVKALFSADIEPKIDVLSQALDAVMDDVGALTATLWGVPVRFGPNRNRDLKAALGKFDEIVFAIIEERRGGQRRDDLLQMLLEARDEDTGEGLDDRRLRDEVVTMIAAGHETTATMLAWAWYALAQNPEVDNRFRAEVARVLGERPVAVTDFDSMPYSRGIIMETLRLYPPVWAIARQLTQDDSVGGYDLEQERASFVCPYMLHRHADYWPEPERFDPTRFDEATSADRPRYAWIPFGGGPHLCTGRHFAMMEGQIIMPTLAQRFTLSLAPGHPVEPEPLVTLRHRYGLKMQVHRV